VRCLKDTNKDMSDVYNKNSVYLKPFNFKYFWS